MKKHPYLFYNNSFNDYNEIVCISDLYNVDGYSRQFCVIGSMDREGNQNKIEKKKK